MVIASGGATLDVSWLWLKRLPRSTVHVLEIHTQLKLAAVLRSSNHTTFEREEEFTDTIDSSYYVHKILSHLLIKTHTHLLSIYMNLHVSNWVLFHCQHHAWGVLMSSSLQEYTPLPLPSSPTVLSVLQGGACLTCHLESFASSTIGGNRDWDSWPIPMTRRRRRRRKQQHIGIH